MLVKTNTDCLRVNFYKLSKRVLKAASHRNSTANHYVQVREFFCSNRACRVNRSTRFINNSKFNIAVLVVFADNLTYNSLNFLRTGSVSNSQNLNVILINCVVDCVVGTLWILLLENLKEAKIFSCFIKGSTLCTVAVTRVNTKNAASLNWLLHQKVFKVFTENSNSVVICIISFVTADFADNSRAEQTYNAVFNCVFMIVIVDCGFFLKLCNCGININVDCNFKGTFAFTAVNSKNAVRFNLIKRLRIVPVHLVSRSFFCLFSVLSVRNNTLCYDISCSKVKVVDCFTVLCFLAYALSNDILGTGKCVSGSFHIKSGILIISFDEFFSFFFARCIVVVGKDKVCKRFQSFFLGKHTASLLLFLEWSPEVFQSSKSCCAHYGIVK